MDVSRAIDSPLSNARRLARRNRRSMIAARLNALPTQSPPRLSWATLLTAPISSCISLVRWGTGRVSREMAQNVKGVISVETRVSGQLMVRM